MRFFVLVFAAVIVIFWIGAEQKPFCRENYNTQVHVDIKEVVALPDLNISFVYVNGSSMFPTIKNDSTCVCVKKKKYVVGDIIVFPLTVKGGLRGVIHRINVSENGTIMTKGDNNKNRDSPIPEKNVFCYVPEIPWYLKLFY